MIMKSEKFDQWLELNGYADNTRRDYSQRARSFIEFSDGKITQDELDRYFLAIGKNFSNKTLNCYRDAVSAYCKFKKLDLTVPRRLKEERTIPNIITIDEFEHKIIPILMDVFHDPTKPIAILDLLFKSGLRKSEICALKRKDIDLKNKKGKVYRSKSNDQHIFFFDSVSAIRMERYFLFSSQEKNAFNIGRGGINYIFEKLNKKLPDKKLSAHLLRHSLATRLLEEGVNLKYIQKILGHQSISSTTRYTQVNTEAVQKSYLEAMDKSWNKKMKKKRKKK